MNHPVLSATFVLLSVVNLSDKTPSGKDRQINARPNILLINVDDLGWKDLGYMGSKYYETPNIDRLSSQGMIFTHAYSAAANCAPSRASLFSGMYCTRARVSIRWGTPTGERR